LLFELCPYGIWNVMLFSVQIVVIGFELCPYGIWNLATTDHNITDKENLNFVPMGFETWFYISH